MSRSSRFVRFGAGLGLAAVGAVTIAARAQSGTQPPSPAAGQSPKQSPAAAPKTMTAPGGMVQQDSAAMQPTPAMLQDSMSAQGVPTRADSAQPSMTEKEAPQTVARWPVDPATGYSMINGQPVVGRVFLLEKTDGLRPYEGIKDHYVGEPLPPLEPAIGTGYVQPPPQNVRRARNVMVQATLWELDHHSPMHSRHYSPVTTTDAAATGR